MNLFDFEIDSNKNLLPKDGVVNYFGKILNNIDADQYYNRLLNTINWQNDQAKIFGKLIITKRKVAWYGDTNFAYSYSNITKRALVWTPELLELKSLAEKTTGETFNSCLLNLYHNGNEGMAWHSDGERDLKKNGVIGSMSFGAERKFAFKTQNNQRNGIIDFRTWQFVSYERHHPNSLATSTAAIKANFNTQNKPNISNY